MVRQPKFKQGDFVYMDRGKNLSSSDTHIRSIYYVERDSGDSMDLHLRETTEIIDLPLDRSHRYRNDICKSMPGKPRMLDRFHLHTSDNYEIW